MKFMQHVTMALLALLISTAALGQKRHIKKAEKAFQKGEYTECLERLQKAEEKGAVLSDPIMEMRAGSYYKLDQKGQALEVYEKIDPANLSSNGLGYYGLLLQGTMNYSKAKEMLEQAEAKGAQNPQFDKALKAVNWAQENDYFMEGYEVSQASLKINGASGGVQFYKDGLVYSKAAQPQTAERDFRRFQFTDMNYVNYNGNSFTNHRVFSNELKFPFAAGAITFNSDNSAMYFTKVMNGKGSKQVAQIYRADYGQSEWYSDVKSLSVNSDEYSCAMPAMGPEDDYLVFASDMPGGQGGYDLYISYKEGNKWSKPRNMGEEVNSSGDEIFPYIDPNGILYYSSDGHMGFGGLDVFSAIKEGNTWTYVENMQTPINSGRDDFSFVLNPGNLEEGFLVSNRAEGGRFDQVYKVQLPPREAIYSEEFLSPSDGGEDLSDFLETGGSDDGQDDNNDALDDFLAEESESSDETTTDGDGEASLEDALKEAYGNKEGYVYRVQFLSSIKPMDQLKTFKPTGDFVYRYYYKDLYRYTIGEFFSPEPAIELLQKVKELGYEDAFVAVFQDKERVLDVAVYKHNREKQKANQQ